MTFFRLCSRRPFLLLVLMLFAAVTGRAEPRLEVIEFTSQTLKHNPLHDPSVRQLAIFLPAQYTNDVHLPVVYYLPGYGGAPERYIKDKAQWLKFTQRVADEVAPMLFVMVDGRTRWGGSQYLNSSAQGNYADYVCEEIVSLVEASYRVAPGRLHRIIAGHSSGGFGALRLGILHPELFDAVVALSPDSDFQLSHLPLVKRPGVTNVSLAEVQAIAAADPPASTPKNGDLKYALGLSAAYAPRGWWHKGQFDWLYDARGNFREKVWQRWLANDPLTIVQQDRHAFLLNQAIYVEGPTQDSYKANVGARKIYELLRDRPARSTFYEPTGKHGDRVPERLERGLAWVFERPLQDLK